MRKNVFRRYRGWLIALAVVCVLVGGYALAYFIVRGAEPLYLSEIEDGYRVGSSPACDHLRRTHPVFTWAAALGVSLGYRMPPGWCYKLMLREYAILERGEMESDFRRKMGFPPFWMGGVMAGPFGKNWKNPYAEADRACEERFGPWPKPLPYPVRSE